MEKFDKRPLNHTAEDNSTQNQPYKKPLLTFCLLEINHISSPIPTHQESGKQKFRLFLLSTEISPENRRKSCKKTGANFLGILTETDF